MLAIVNQWLQQPSTLSWLLLVATLALAFIAACVLLGTAILFALGRYVRQRASFTELAQPLLDAGELEALVTLCKERLATYHDDAWAHYFMGQALHRRGELRLALTYLKRIPKLQAGWDVSAMVEAIERKLASGEERPELSVVPGPQSQSES